VAGGGREDAAAGPPRADGPAGEVRPVRPVRRPADDPGWRFYPETVIELWRRRGGPRVHLDCREPVDAATRAALAGIGLPGPFVVITACAPGGARLGPAASRRRTARLARRLRAFGPRPVRADGGSPDRTHVEPGWAADLAREEARRIAAEAGQSAIFRFDGRAMWIEPVLVDAAPIRLPPARRPPAR
jgi:hypothetical protein